MKLDIQTGVEKGRGERERHVVMAMDEHCPAHMCTMLWTVHAT